MRPLPFPHPQPTPLILTPKDEAILQAVATYRFLTSQEITALFYKKGSQTYARARCSRLCGNKDVTDAEFTYGYPLYRVGFPTGRLGNQERIYCLSAIGARIIEGLGYPMPWHVKRAKVTFSHSTWLHDLTRNRFVVALLTWAKSRPNLRIESHLSYELSKQPPTVSIPVLRAVLEKGKMVKVSVMGKVPVIPDGVVLVTSTRTNQRLLILLEIDKNTHAAARLRNHIATRLAYVRSQHFRDTYGHIPYLIVYATQGVTDAASRSRLAYLCEFTKQFLLERKRPQDSQYFRFTTINYQTLYEDVQALCEEPVWVRPSDPTTPVSLLTG